MASVNSTVIARVAAGLYDLQLGNASMTWALNAVDSVTYGGDLGALVQQLYNTDFKAAGNAALAATIVKNVGITGDAAAVAYVTNVLNANAGHEGAAIVAMLNGLSGITSGPYAAAATGFNTQIGAASRYAQTLGSVDAIVHAPESTEGKNFTLTASKVGGLDVMNLHGDQDVRIDFTNSNNQIVGLDLDGDGTIEFDGKERSVTGKASNFEIVDAYPRNPLDHTDIVNNFLGDIYFDGSSGVDKDGDGTKNDGNIFLGGLGNDTALGGVGNDFMAGGGVAQGHLNDADDDDGDGDDFEIEHDALYGGRNADFFFGEFSKLDIVDGNGNHTLYVDGGNTSDDQPAGAFQSDQDNDWFLIEASDDDEPVSVFLNEFERVDDGDIDVETRSGESMDLDDVENLDASGNLYGFLDAMTDGAGNQLRIGGRSYDSRYDGGANKGSVNYGIGSSAQLDVDGSDVANIIVAGYDNDFVEAWGGNDLIFGGNLQFLFETVAGGATNLNLANITLDGLDHIYGLDGNDGIVFEADGGIVDGGANTDTLWVTDYALGTNTLASSVSDGRLRFDLGAQADLADPDSDPEPGFAGYGGADRTVLTPAGRVGTADQTNYATGAKVAPVLATGFEIVDASGLSSGVRGLDYFSAGTNAASDHSFSNRQNFWGYDGSLDLRGSLNVDNQLYAGAGDDVIEARGGNAASAGETLTSYDNSMQGGAGNDDFYFAVDGDDGGDETNIIRRKVDANNDGWWDASSATATAGTWGQDFGLDSDSETGASVLTIRITDSTKPGAELGDVVNAVTSVVTAVKQTDGTFTPVVLNSAAIAAAETYAALAGALDSALKANATFGADLSAVLLDDGVTIEIRDAKGRELGDAFSEGGSGVAIQQIANSQTQNIFQFGPPLVTVSQDRLIFKSYEDRSDNEGVDDDAITGSEISLGSDAYAEDLVVSFASDGTRIAEDQNYIITFTNLTTQDTVTIDVNGVTYTLKVGVANNGSLIDGEDTRHTALETVQSNFLTRLVAFIDSFMDDDTAAGQVDARVITGVDFNLDGDTADAGEAAAINRIGLTQVVYHDGEETVFMSGPVVTLVNASGERPSSSVDNDAQTEVFLQGFNGRDNKLNDQNVLFWGDEAISRAVLETAPNGGASGDKALVGSEALVIDGGHGAGDDDLDDEDGNDIPHNLATDDGEIDWDAATDFQLENFAVHGDDYLIGGAGSDTISGLTGDDRVRGSLGKDTLDGGKDWYAVLDEGESDYHLEYLNAHEAEARDGDGDVLDIQLVLQTESGHSLIAPTDESPEERYEAYFEDTLIYHQGDFTPGVSRFTITLDGYEGEGEDIEFVNGGAGKVDVDNDGNGTVEPENHSTFTNFENIRTVAGVGLAVAGKGGGQGRDTLNINDLSDDSDVGVRYFLTGDFVMGDPARDASGDVQLLEDLDFVDIDEDEEDDFVIDNIRVVIKVDGPENVLFGDGNDQLVIDETEAAKDNEVFGDSEPDSTDPEEDIDSVYYTNDFANEEHQGDDEPTVTVVVGSKHDEGADSSSDEVKMTEGRVGTVVATDKLVGIEELFIYGNTAAGNREDDEINVEKLSGGAVVNYVTGEILSDTDGDLDFEDGELQVTIVGIEQFEVVRADGDDAVVLASAEQMALNKRTDTFEGEDFEAAPPAVTIEEDLAVPNVVDGDDAPEGVDPKQLIINTFLNYDLLDQRNLDKAGVVPERLTISELRTIDPGTDDTADEDDIPEAFNFAQFKFLLGQDTDTVDYSQATDSIVAVLDITSKNDTQYVMVDRDDDPDSLFNAVDDELGDRVDLMTGVERIVASLSESVLDFTPAEADVIIDFEFDNDDEPEDGDIITTTIRIADGKGNQLTNISQMVERWTFNDPFGDDGILTDDDAAWTRIEGSDASEKVSYDGSENLPEQAGLDHRFTNDTLNLRGGLGNTVSYNKLETSITATLLGMVPYAEDEDPEDPGVGVDTLDTGFMALSVNFADADLDDEVNAATGTHVITSHTIDNEIAAGYLKIEASQDDSDVISFAGFGDDLTYVLGQSPGVILVGLLGQEDSLRLTGFEFFAEADTDDVYVVEDLELSLFDLVLIDNPDDRDTLQLLDLDEAIDFTDIDGDTISLQVINDEFGFDFDVLDISRADDESGLVLIGDDDLGRDNVATADGLDDGGDADSDDEDVNDGLPDDADDLIVGDLSLIESMALFSGLWLTDASVATDNTFVLDTTAVNFVLQDSEEDDADAYFDSIIGGISELNFSKVTSTDLTISVLGDAGMVLIGGGGDDEISGGGGDDIIAGGGGDDDLDGGLSSEVWEIEITGAMLSDASGSDIVVDFNGVYSVTINEGDEVPEGAGVTQIATALRAAIVAELDDINLAEPFGPDVAVSVERIGTILRFTFTAGTDIDEGANFIDIDGSGNGNTIDGEIASAFDPTADGSAGGSDTFVFNSAAEGADTIANFLTGDDSIVIGGALAAAIDDGGDEDDPADDGSIDWTDGPLVATSEGLYVESSTLTEAQLSDLTRVATLLRTVFGATDTDLNEEGDDLLIAIENAAGDAFGLYYFTDADDGGDFDATELTLIAVVSADDMDVFGDIGLA